MLRPSHTPASAALLRRWSQAGNSGVRPPRVLRPSAKRKSTRTFGYEGAKLSPRRTYPGVPRGLAGPLKAPAALTAPPKML